VVSRPLTEQIEGKQKKNMKNQNLPQKTLKRDRVELELHNDSTKEGNNILRRCCRGREDQLISS
jgi:hypothetical protein